MKFSSISTLAYVSIALLFSSIISVEGSSKACKKCVKKCVKGYKCRKDPDPAKCEKKAKKTCTKKDCKKDCTVATASPSGSPTASPTAFPTAAPGPSYTLVAANKKCPENGTRLFKGSKFTKDTCFQKCVDTPNCVFFSFGESAGLSAIQRNLCILCNGSATQASHPGFNHYTIV